MFGPSSYTSWTGLAHGVEKRGRKSAVRLNPIDSSRDWISLLERSTLPTIGPGLDRNSWSAKAREWPRERNHADAVPGASPKLPQPREEAAAHRADQMRDTLRVGHCSSPVQEAVAVHGTAVRSAVQSPPAPSRAEAFSRAYSNTAGPTGRQISQSSSVKPSPRSLNADGGAILSRAVQISSNPTHESTSRSVNGDEVRRERPIQAFDWHGEQPDAGRERCTRRVHGAHNNQQAPPAAGTQVEQLIGKDWRPQNAGKSGHFSVTVNQCSKRHLMLDYD